MENRRGFVQASINGIGSVWGCELIQKAVLGEDACQARGH